MIIENIYSFPFNFNVQSAAAYSRVMFPELPLDGVLVQGIEFLTVEESTRDQLANVPIQNNTAASCFLTLEDIDGVKFVEQCPVSMFIKKSGLFVAVTGCQNKFFNPYRVLNWQNCYLEVTISKNGATDQSIIAIIKYIRP
jgi:hypothetical protein